MGEIIRSGEEESRVVNPYETIPHSSFSEQMDHLNELLDQRDPQEILRAFQDNPLLAKTAIIEKGDNLSHLDSLQEATDILLKEKYGSDVHLGNITASQIKEISGELELPSTFWTAISESAFHKNDERLFKHLNKEYKNAFLNDLYTQNILDHDLNSWIGSRGKDPKRAGELNKIILNGSKEQEIDPRLKQKILFGIRLYRFQSGQKHKDAPERMIGIAEEMKKLSMPETSRAYEEAAKMALEIGDFNQAEEHLKLGIEIAHDEKYPNYPNAILGLEKTWAKMLKAKGDLRESRKHFLSAVDTSRELGGHYKQETLPEVEAELKDQFPCRILIEIEGMGLLVRRLENGQLEFPEFSLKISEKRFKDLPFQKAKELTAVENVEELLFGAPRPEKESGKKRRSPLAGRIYEEKGKITRDLGKDLTQRVELAQVFIPQKIKIFDSTLTRLRENGYDVISRDELEASENLDAESRKLLSL